MKNIARILTLVCFVVVLTSCSDESNDLQEQITIENELQARGGRAIDPSNDGTIDTMDIME